ncbi:ASCH domain-containing protein [Paraclostridium sordellii]|uniref:ASCH domain-containing protein n=1 Tax=Paraclostridium sordellii TaxID=1505 RepID=UPI0005E662FF|nr:ASCH domain-containing protein [Paeniclostridium sordellii]CEN87327.1 50S ribosomal protein L22/uncharacterised domain fusion protein [[Clostridium] sordellii] [Paeniclostridium sordellii]CEP40949.1 50S ribosomal protein L22/uncharacterised domain fusion protein [[Clostridium] sordellii] [Paeniclostridium sordellii]
MKAILSIKPEFVEKIVSGEKKYEYRKKIFKQNIESVIIYATKPVGMFIGEFKVKDVVHGDLENVWEKTYRESGISQKYFNKYFSNHDKAYALEIKDLIVYDKPVEPSIIIENFKAPQSFCYLRDFEKVNKINGLKK